MKIIKLNEMAMQQSDAIQTCRSQGTCFIKHFHKIYAEGPENPCFNHHCAEMQAWLDSCRKIKLKQDNKPINNVNMIDWFFTAGGGIDEENGFFDPHEVEAYDTFIIRMCDRNSKVRETFIEVINILKADNNTKS